MEFLAIAIPPFAIPPSFRSFLRFGPVGNSSFPHPLLSLRFSTRAGGWREIPLIGMGTRRLSVVRTRDKYKISYRRSDQYWAKKQKLIALTSFANAPPVRLGVAHCHRDFFRRSFSGKGVRIFYSFSSIPVVFLLLH